MDVGKKAQFYIAGGVANWCSHSRKQCGESSENLELDPPFDPVISFLTLYSKDLAYYSIAVTSIFIAA